MNEGRIKGILKQVSRFFVFFLLVAFVVTCTTSLFISTMSRTMGLALSEEDLGLAAKLTFVNVVLLSLFFFAIDTLRRKFMVERPVKQITEATRKIMQGDFSVRLEPQSGFGGEETFGEIAQCINQMAQELQSVETLRTDFIANVSHEMKTPLAVMQNYGKLLQEPDLPEEQRLEYARGVADGTRRMADMMTNILKLNRLENQQIYPQITEFDLGEQVCECLLQYEAIWEKAHIELETDIAEDVTVRADGELLRLVWNNLFSNAFKFTPEGGRVRVRLWTEGDRAAVQVQDTGCGMTAEVGAHIFEKFYQGDSSHSARGNGLGLALVKRVVDILHGEIGVESTVGVGSTFTVWVGRF